MPAKSLAEFIAAAKADPGKFNYASPGAATQTHLVVELLSQKAGIKLQHIPYRGGAPAIQAMVAGDTQFTAISTLASLPHMRSGALRAIATGSLARETQFPDLPTVAEQGFPGFEAIQWIGLLTTAGTPTAIVERINAEVNRALRDPDLIGKLAAAGSRGGGRDSRRLSAHHRDRHQDLDRDRARRQHQGGVIPASHHRPTRQAAAPTAACNGERSQPVLPPVFTTEPIGA